jgi:hypothetical protein
MPVRTIAYATYNSVLKTVYACGQVVDNSASDFVASIQHTLSTSFRKGFQKACEKIGDNRAERVGDL